MPTAISQEEVKQLIEQRRWTELKERLSGLLAPELADQIEALDPAQRMLVFRALPRAQANEVFAYLEIPKQDELVRNLTNEDARQIVAGLTPDDRTALLEELPAEVTQRLLSLLTPEDLKEARTLLGYRRCTQACNSHSLIVQPSATVLDRGHLSHAEAVQSRPPAPKADFLHRAG